MTKDAVNFYYGQDTRTDWHGVGIGLSTFPDNRLACYHPIITPQGITVATINLKTNTLEGILKNGKKVDLPEYVLRFCFPGTNIRIRRVRKHISQIALAEKCGLHYQTIVKIEQNPEIIPDQGTYDKLAAELGDMEWRTYPIQQIVSNGRIYKEKA